MKSILIIRCGALGDLVTSTSIIEALKLEFGEDTLIDFVCTPGAGTIFNKDTRVHQVFPLQHKKIPILFSKQKRKIIKHSQNNPYDYLINFERGKQFESLVKQINASKKIGHFFTKIEGLTETTHTSELKKLIFKEIVNEDIFKSVHPKLIGTDKKQLDEHYTLSDKYFIVSPSNSHQKKNKINHRAWVDENWIELIELLSKEIEVVIIGNKNEDAFFDKLKPYPNNVLDLVGKTSLPDLIGIINHAAGLVSTDTGTAHIASALDTEVFTLIGPTPAEQTGPFKSPSNKVHIISQNLDCAPCYRSKTMKNCIDNICMKQISSQKVYETIKKALL